MCIVSRPIRCEMKPQQITATKLPNRPKTSVTYQNLQRYKFTSFVRRRFLGYKKIRFENHQSQPTSMTTSTARETNAVQHRLWLAHFFCSQTRCLAMSDPVCLTQHRYSVKYRSYLLFADIQAEIEKEPVHAAFDNSKHEDLSRKKQPARCVSC